MEADGTYYVAAGASGRKKGTYTVTVTENPAVQAAPAVAPDDFAADASTTGTVAVGGSATGEIERAGDSDWFAVTLKAGKTYTVDLKGRDTGDGTLKDPYLDGVFDAAGRLVGATWDYDSGEGRNSRTTVAVEADGTYYVAAGASGRKKGTYTVTVTEVPDDFAADASTTGTVAVGGSATGEVERAGDRDWFAVTLESGKSYTVDLKGRVTGDGTLKDPYLHGVFDAAGRPVDATWDDDSGEGRNSRTTVAVEADGTYYVAAGASGRKKGTYTVTVTEVPDDFVADASTTGTVAVGGSATGEIEQPHDRRRGGGRHVLRGGRRFRTRGRHLHGDGDRGPGRFRGRRESSRHGCGRRLGDGRDRTGRRPRLVRGDARGGQVLHGRPEGAGHRRWHAGGPEPRRGFQERPNHRPHVGRRRRRGAQQPHDRFCGDGRHILRGSRRTRHWDLRPVGCRRCNVIRVVGYMRLRKLLPRPRRKREAGWFGEPVLLTTRTNGIVERFHNTVLNEFYRVAVRKRIYTTLKEPQEDFEAWMREYHPVRENAKAPPPASATASTITWKARRRTRALMSPLLSSAFARPPPPP